MNRTVAAALAGVSFPLSAAAEVHTVGSDGYPTITQALEAAAEGDEILVQPGTYPERIVIRRRVTIRSTDGAESTVLTPPAGLAGIKVQPDATGTVIEGLTVQGASASDGAGIDIRADGVTVRDCALVDNVAEGYGGGIQVAQASNVLVDGCSFEGNQALYGGGFSVKSGSATLLACTFHGNAASDAGGGALASEGELTIDGGTFLSNSAHVAGGGAAIQESSGTVVVGSTFQGNSSDATGGGLVTRNAYILVAGNRFEDNDSYQAGSGAAAYLSTMYFHNNEVLTNVAEDGISSVYYEDWSTGIARNNVIRQNTYTGDGGGALVCELSDVYVVNNLIVGNESSVGGGGVLVGSIQVIEDQPSVGWVENNTLVRNEASAGHGILFFNGEGVIRNNIAAFAPSPVYGFSDASAFPHAFLYNLAWDAGSGWVTELEPEAEQGGNFIAEPRFVAFSDDDDYSNDDFHLASDSPARDAGDPALLDADGTPADLGCYGGVFAAGWDNDPYVDDDGDGLSDLDGDCDDVHAAALPGGNEVCDRLDNDCDGLVDEDLDCQGPILIGDDDTSDDDVAGDDDAADDDSTDGGGPGGCEGCGAAGNGEPSVPAALSAGALLFAARRRRG